MNASSSGAIPAPLHVSIVGLGFQRLPFVVGAFAGADTDEQFGSTVDPVDLQRDDGDTLGGHSLGEFADFPLMCEQTPRSSRIVLVGGRGVRVFGDVHAVQGQSWWIEFCTHVAFLKAGLAVAERLDLGSQKVEPAFKGLGDEVVMPGPSIANQRLVVTLVGFFA